MLIGQFSSKLTDKNRLAVPKKFRQELGEKVIIAKWYEKSLVMVSKDSWEKLRTRLVGKIEIITSPVRDVDRFILGSAFEVDLDSQGRFVLFDSLIEHAGITEEVVFVGLENRIEIWSKEIWSELETVAEKKAATAIEKIASVYYKKGGDADD